MACGAEGSVFVISRSNLIWKLDIENDKWEPYQHDISGVANLTVDHKGNLWVTKIDKTIMRQSPGNKEWQSIPGTAVDISAGGEGTVMIITAKAEDENVMIWNEILW